MAGSAIPCVMRCSHCAYYFNGKNSSIYYWLCVEYSLNYKSMQLTKEEIKKRLRELETKPMTDARAGEMFGLCWVLEFWDSGYYAKLKDKEETSVEL